MAIKTILTVTGTAEDDRDVRLAAELCEEIGAHLSVLVTALAAPPPIGDYAAVISEAWLEERREDEQRLKARAEDSFPLRGGNDHLGRHQHRVSRLRPPRTRSSAGARGMPTSWLPGQSFWPPMP